MYTHPRMCRFAIYGLPAGGDSANSWWMPKATWVEGNQGCQGPKVFLGGASKHINTALWICLKIEINVYKVGPRADRYKWSEITSINGRN